MPDRPGHGGDTRIGNSSPLGVRAADGTLERAVNYPLPARGTFTTRSTPPASMTDIRAFTTANAPAIAAIVRDELKPAGMKTYVDANNLTRLFRASGPFGPGIMSHHLFVAELAHEIVD